MQTDSELRAIRGAKDSQFVLCLWDGITSVDMLVPPNFYNLPADQAWARYLKPAFTKMRNEREAKAA